MVQTLFKGILEITWDSVAGLVRLYIHVHICEELCPWLLLWAPVGFWRGLFYDSMGPSSRIRIPDHGPMVWAAELSTGLEVEQPANAYDSVVAMLQSWLVGGTPVEQRTLTESPHGNEGGIALVLIYGAALVASVANPLTKRHRVY